ncbi:dihydrofolate reductase [Candidatus Cloacimonas acidaminovorans]|uniref:dihydrofolate reductase n=1 Tax=Candidatus Cloacimonas acidaminovorans TaxID=456827 RepID=UPI002A4E1591|nr:dihydrofolate reductase [Candidatus Cloacimonas acidaminovorans]
MLSIIIIVAYDLNHLIGKNGILPWKITEDLKRFKAITMGHPVIMGKNTWNSIGKPLPGRQNIVLSKDRNFQPQGAIVAHSLEEALKMVEGQEAYIIGGASVFKQFLPLADKMLITLIHSEFEGDTYFPYFSEEDWILQESSSLLSSSGYELCLQIYIRKNLL